MPAFRPMRAAKAPEDLAGLLRRVGPMIAEPKIDGWRAATPADLGAVAASLKPFPNLHIRAALSDPLLAGLDGEVTAGDDPTAPDVHNRTQVLCSSRDMVAPFTFTVFDDITTPSQRFLDRMKALAARTTGLSPFVRVVERVVVHTIADVEAFERQCLAAGYEGIMLRNPRAAYKLGDATAGVAELLKLKRFEDFEAEVTGVVEMYHNRNAATVNALGLTERSTASAGLVPSGIIGTLVCRAPGWSEEFGVAVGHLGLPMSFAAQLHGQLAKLKHQPHGAKDRPRSTTFIGVRDRADMFGMAA